MKRTWARDLWHLCHRLIRKILSHTVLIWLAVEPRIPPLSFDRLRRPRKLAHRVSQETGPDQ